MVLDLYDTIWNALIENRRIILKGISIFSVFCIAKYIVCSDRQQVIEDCISDPYNKCFCCNDNDKPFKLYNEPIITYSALYKGIGVEGNVVMPFNYYDNFTYTSNHYKKRDAWSFRTFFSKVWLNIKGIYLNILKKAGLYKEKKIFCEPKFKDEFVRSQTELMSLKILENYFVSYKNPLNFIYVYNNITKIPLKANGDFDFLAIVKLYMSQFYLETIEYVGKGITSFPVYPNMIKCILSGNKIEVFGVQPAMVHCNLKSNKIRVFSVQPRMEHCDLQCNNLTTFGIQPAMLYCNLNYNKLSSFPIQPEMTECYIRHNCLTTFPGQSKMVKCEIDNPFFLIYQEALHSYNEKSIKEFDVVM